VFKGLKDKTLSIGVKRVFNYYLKNIGGEMLNFSLDSQNKKIFLDVMLKGEAESLKVEIKNYKITQKEDKSFIEFDEVVTSREWINKVLELYANKQEFDIPNEYAKLLGVVV